MALTDVVDLTAESACFLCLGPREQAAVTAGLLVQILKNLDPMAQTDVATLMDDAKCFMCLEPKQMAAISLQLLTQLVECGQVVACGTTDPVADPGSTCQLYYNRTNSSFWYWDDALGIWVALIV